MTVSRADSWGSSPRFSSPLLALALMTSLGHAAGPNGGTADIELRVQPRVCSLSSGEDTCEATVKAQWRAPANESLCVVIVDRPDVRRCWENFSEGTYEVELTFDRDLTVQLRDPQLQQVLASQTIAVIKEALQLRRKRRQPWNLLY